jgi:hypothetical protein
MRTSSVIIVVMLLLAAAPTQSRAQTPPSLSATADVETIRRHIQSDVASEQAWGAWLAGQTMRTELVPDLVKLGSRIGPATDPHGYVLAAVVLDALVQLKAGPEASWSLQFFARWPAQTLILLSRAGRDAEAPLLEMARTQTGYRWLAAANLLLTRKPLGFAATLLNGMTIRADLVITRSANSGFGSGDGSSITVGDGISAGRAGFPPLAHYYLTEFAYAGAVVLARGPTTIHYIREISPPGSQGPASSADRPAPTTKDRLAYIAALRGVTPDTLALKANESKTVVWNSGMEIDRQVEIYRAEILKSYEGLARTLVREGLLTDAEAQALHAPAIIVTVHDKR